MRSSLCEPRREARRRTSPIHGGTLEKFSATGSRKVFLLPFDGIKIYRISIPGCSFCLGNPRPLHCEGVRSAKTHKTECNTLHSVNTYCGPLSVQNPLEEGSAANAVRAATIVIGIAQSIKTVARRLSSFPLY
jgi:hypothetical protein